VRDVELVVERERLERLSAAPFLEKPEPQVERVALLSNALAAGVEEVDAIDRMQRPPRCARRDAEPARGRSAPDEHVRVSILP
jgi:hypothetical protein